MTSDPVIFQFILLFGAFFAGIVQGATGFGSGIVLNAFWLHILEPSAAISLNIVSCLFVSALPIYKLRKTLDFSKLKPFVIFGVLGIPTGLFILTLTDPTIFKTTVGFILVLFSIWKFRSKNIFINFKSSPSLDKLIGFIFGAFRGVLIVVLLFLGFKYLVGENLPEWLLEAYSFHYLDTIGNILKEIFLDEDVIVTKEQKI